MTRNGSFFVATLINGSAEISGDEAGLRCDLVTQTNLPWKAAAPEQEGGEVKLKKSGNRWLIEDPGGHEYRHSREIR